METSAPAPAGSVVGILLTVAAAELQLEATVTHYGWYMTAVRNFDGIGVRFQNLSRQADDILRELRSRSADRPRRRLRWNADTNAREMQPDSRPAL